ncbi:MAG: spondin domain-containing protein [Longimicrobiales bacterium]|nr:spondin domain-containing protein [Longimicrobiales bacterium]
MKHRSLLAIPLLLAASACLDEAPTSVEPQFSRADAATGEADAASYRVTIHNLTEGQPLTPPLAVTHRQAISIFQVGEPAGFGVQQVAENGNLTPLVESLQTERHAKDWRITQGPTLPPVLPGEMVQFDIDTERGAKYLSFISMLICTNDGFTGTDSARLPRDVGASVTLHTAGYDAGTEINTEDFADLVPPCPALTGVESMEPGTGMSDPALAENGVVRIHPGIDGDADLDPDIHGWTDPVARIEIERIG